MRYTCCQAVARHQLIGVLRIYKNRRVHFFSQKISRHLAIKAIFIVELKPCERIIAVEECYQHIACAVTDKHLEYIDPAVVCRKFLRDNRFYNVIFAVIYQIRYCGRFVEVDISSRIMLGKL